MSLWYFNYRLVALNLSSLSSLSQIIVDISEKQKKQVRIFGFGNWNEIYTVIASMSQSLSHTQTYEQRSLLDRHSHIEIFRLSSVHFIAFNVREFGTRKSIILENKKKDKCIPAMPSGTTDLTSIFWGHLKHKNIFD